MSSHRKTRARWSTPSHSFSY